MTDASAGNFVMQLGEGFEDVKVDQGLFLGDAPELLDSFSFCVETHPLESFFHGLYSLHIEMLGLKFHHLGPVV